MSDPLKPVEELLRSVLSSLDSQYTPPALPEQYLQQLAPQIRDQLPVIVNGTPVSGRVQFQQQWVQTPLTQHQLTGWDAHIVTLPASNIAVVNAQCRVKFDESARSRTGETALVNAAAVPNNAPQKPAWGLWHGVSLTLTVDLNALGSGYPQCIETINYRTTYKPELSIVV